jgi:hypothetical protein
MSGAFAFAANREFDLAFRPLQLFRCRLPATYLHSPTSSVQPCLGVGHLTSLTASVARCLRLT